MNSPPARALPAALALASMLAAFHLCGPLIFLAPGLLTLALRGLGVRHQMLLCGAWGVAFSGLFHLWALTADFPAWCCLLLARGLPWTLFPLPAWAVSKVWPEASRFASPLSKTSPVDTALGEPSAVASSLSPSSRVDSSLSEPSPLTSDLHKPWLESPACGLGLALVTAVLLAGPGLDWETPIAALAGWPWCLSVLPWLGLSGAGLLIGVISALLVSGRRAPTGFGVALLGLWTALGLLFNSPQGKPWPSVAVIQTGWQEHEKWAIQNVDEAARRLVSLTRKAREQGATLVIWPETAWPDVSLRKNAADTAGLERMAKSLSIDLLVSSLEMGERGWSNSISQLSPQGTWKEEYAKRRLLPMQEYLPFPESVEAFLRRRGWVRSSCHYLAGDRDVIFSSGASSFATLICYESTVPEPAQRVADNCDFLVVMTNDAPLGSSFAKEAHFRSAILRAAELRKPVFQASNNGVSGFIGPSGEVLRRTPPGFEGPTVLVLPAGGT